MRFIRSKYLTNDTIGTVRVADIIWRVMWHDVDKMVLYTLMDKKEASAIHKRLSRHHMYGENISINRKEDLDIMEAILDYECSGFTKVDKPMNAYDTITKIMPGRGLPPELQGRMLDIMDVMGIRKESYQNTPDDPEWQEFLKTCNEPTEQNITIEIYDYLSTVKGNSFDWFMKQK
jgi:hypothetical protein